MTVIDSRYESSGPSESGLRYGIIEATSSCQLSCPGCYMVRRSHLNRGAMTLAQAVRVLDLCRDFIGHELETMDILGGEPLLWPQLNGYIEILLRRGIQPWIFTNMVAITAMQARWLFERQVHITGKLNIANPSDAQQLRLQAEMIGSGQNNARRLFAAIDVFRQAGYRDPLFRLQNLIRQANIHLVPEFMRFCRNQEVGMDLELMGSGEAIDQNYWEVAPTPQQLADMIRSLENQNQLKTSPSLNETSSNIWPETDNPVEHLLMPHVFGACPFYDKGLYFAVDGHIRSCSNSTQQLALITDPSPIQTAWDSELLHNRRSLSQKNVGEPCRSCDRWTKCRGGCRATVEGMGDSFGGYTLCPLPLLR